MCVCGGGWSGPRAAVTWPFIRHQRIEIVWGPNLSENKFHFELLKAKVSVPDPLIAGTKKCHFHVLKFVVRVTSGAVSVRTWGPVI